MLVRLTIGADRDDNSRRESLMLCVRLRYEERRFTQGWVAEVSGRQIGFEAAKRNFYKFVGSGRIRIYDRLPGRNIGRVERYEIVEQQLGART